jgi:hypothetical protein
VAAGLVAGLGTMVGTTVDVSADAIATIPASVHDVRMTGIWEDEDAVGAYRIVITRAGSESVTTRLFVQWIAVDDAGEATVADSIEIPELAEFGLDIVDYESESDDDGLTVYVKTLDPSDGFSETYELFVFSPTEYVFGPASN